MDLLLKEQNKTAAANPPEIEHLRPALTAYAYNILGTIDEAKDIVQDAFLKFMYLRETSVINPKAYLIRTVINLAINQKKRQKKLVSEYYGQWLPEPVSADNADTVINSKEVLSYSLMVLLEKLNALQRAVFILKEAFDYEHSEIAEAVGISEAYSRQLLSRAKKQVRVPAPVDRNRQESTVHKYLEVIRRGDAKQLEHLLKEDIMVISDGGGKVSAGKNPVCGKKDAKAMLLGIYKKFYQQLPVKYGTVNHQPALFYSENGKISSCQIISIDKGMISDVFIVRNPDKLKLLQKSF